MPLLTRLPKARVKTQVVCLSPGAVPAAVLRQNGVPVHDVALSRKRFSVGALRRAGARPRRHFEPDVIQAWGHTAQIVSTGVAQRCDRSSSSSGRVAQHRAAAARRGFHRSPEAQTRREGCGDGRPHRLHLGSRRVAASSRRFSGRRPRDHSAGRRRDALQARPGRAPQDSRATAASVRRPSSSAWWRRSSPSTTMRRSSRRSAS